MFALKGEAAGLFIAATMFDAKKQNKANKQTNKQPSVTGPKFLPCTAVQEW